MCLLSPWACGFGLVSNASRLLWENEVIVGRKHMDQKLQLVGSVPKSGM